MKKFIVDLCEAEIQLIIDSMFGFEINRRIGSEDWSDHDLLLDKLHKIIHENARQEQLHQLEIGNDDGKA